MSFEEQIVSKDEYPSTFSRQMIFTVYLVASFVQDKLSEKTYKIYCKMSIFCTNSSLSKNV